MKTVDRCFLNPNMSSTNVQNSNIFSLQSQRKEISKLNIQEAGIRSLCVVRLFCCPQTTKNNYFSFQNVSKDPVLQISCRAIRLTLNTAATSFSSSEQTAFFCTDTCFPPSWYRFGFWLKGSSEKGRKVEVIKGEWKISGWSWTRGKTPICTTRWTQYISGDVGCIAEYLHGWRGGRRREEEERGGRRERREEGGGGPLLLCETLLPRRTACYERCRNAFVARYIT